MPGQRGQKHEKLEPPRAIGYFLKGFQQRQSFFKIKTGIFPGS
jgi:hypothetical protein